MLTNNPFPSARWDGVSQDQAYSDWQDWLWDLLERNGLTDETGITLEGITLAFGFDEAWQAWSKGEEHPWLSPRQPAGEREAAAAAEPSTPAQSGPKARQREKRSALADPDARRVAQHAYDLLKRLAGAPPPPSWIHRAARVCQAVLGGMHLSPDFLIQCLDWMSENRHWSQRLAAFRQPALEQAVMEFRFALARRLQDAGARREATPVPAEGPSTERERRAEEFWFELIRRRVAKAADDTAYEDPRWWDPTGFRPVFISTLDGKLDTAHARFASFAKFVAYIDWSCPGWEDDPHAYLEAKRDPKVYPRP